MRSLIIAAVAALAFATAADAHYAPVYHHYRIASRACRHGMPCGHKCIAGDKVCHKP